MPQIEAINTFGFRLSPGELSIVDGVIVDDDNEIISFGIVKPMAEATFLTNPAKSQRARVTAMQLMMDIAVDKSREFGVKQLHVFCDSEKIVKTLIKRYGFQLVTSNIVLVKNL